MQKITPFLWYDGTVEEAHLAGPGGKMMSATFELEGQQFIAFDGGPQLKFSPAVSMHVNCESQAEVDDLWAKLSDGGAEGQCGWIAALERAFAGE